jgi:hypothetical protein
VKLLAPFVYPQSFRKGEQAGDDAALDRIYAGSPTIVRGQAKQAISTLSPADEANYHKAGRAAQCGLAAERAERRAIFATYRTDAARMRRDRK